MPTNASVIKMIRESIEKAVKAALTELGAGNVSAIVERPGDMAHGDYSTNAALAASKILKKNPREVAEELKVILSAKLLSQRSSGFLARLLGGSARPFAKGVLLSDMQIAGAGFINFYLSRGAIAQEVQQATKEVWGKNTVYGAKRILIEYTSPNLFKPLHIGNLVGNILGESVSRIIEDAGAEIKRINYPSDIGLSVAKGVWGLTTTKGDPSDIRALGEAYRTGNAAYEDGSAKERIEEINRALYENSNPEWSMLRQKGIETSRRHLAELCKKLGTTFDKEFFESESALVGKDIVKNNIGKVFEESEGAVVFHGSHTRVFLNSQGLPTYEAKEVGLFSLKTKTYPGVDMSITVTGGEQKDFFKVVFEAIQKLFPDRSKKRVLRHVANGFLRLTTGKMSSRLGNVITGESLLADLTSDAKEKMKDRNLPDTNVIAEQVAVGAIKYEVLKQGSGKDIIFDPEKSLSLEGDSGPYLQYAHTRAFSLLKAAKEAGITPGTSDVPASTNVLERTLLHFPDAVERAAEELEPHYVTTYLTELASAFNSWYASERVIGGSNPHYGVLLAEAVEKTLAKGLYVLGIPAPEKM